MGRGNIIFLEKSNLFSFYEITGNLNTKYNFNKFRKKNYILKYIKYTKLYWLYKYIKIYILKYRKYISNELYICLIFQKLNKLK